MSVSNKSCMAFAAGGFRYDVSETGRRVNMTIARTLSWAWVWVA